MARLSIPRTLALSLGVFLRLSGLASPAFKTSEIEGPASEILFCDLHGNGRLDAVLVDGTNGSVFYQNASQSFSRAPQRQFRLDQRPQVLWPARLGRQAECLLAMTSDGITELCFTNASGPPARRQIIVQPTIIPEMLDGTQTMSFPFSANTGTEWPLLLVPIAGGLQIWQHQDGWHAAQLIQPAMDDRIESLAPNPGYARSFGLSFCVADVNADGRDDLMVLRHTADGGQIYDLYLQNSNHLFNLEPALSYTNTADWHTKLAWYDLNRDGRLDLVTSTVSDEPSFVPGLQSGKVLVALRFADQQGRIPLEPQQIFRKYDWSAFLPMVDLDGDGFLDLVLGYIPIDSREGIRNLLTAGKVNLNLRLHFYRPGTGFPAEPDCQRNVAVYFGRDFNWTLEQRIYYEKFLSLSGDFNGDGKKDLLVREHSDSISAYFFHSREIGFSPKPDLEFHCPEPMDWWQIKDLNGDGVSDLIIKLRDRDIFRIFLSPGK